jgi:hypothetical protein
LFWLENVSIGFFNVLKILISQPKNTGNWLGKLFFVPFFIFHYGMFTAVHGIFVIILFGSKTIHFSGFPNASDFIQVIQMSKLSLAALMMFLSHGFSFLWNYVAKKEYEKIGIKTLMIKPYGRIIVLHVTIIFGGV